MAVAKKAKLVLIDGNSVFHRGYHALPGLTNSQGVPTSGIYGFANMALRILTEIKPDFVVVAWDKAKTSITARTDIYPEYKAQRKQQPDDFYAQIPYVRQLIDYLGWPFIELDGYEADDIIGTLAQQATGTETIIMTSDLDGLQLVNDSTKVYAQRRGVTDLTIYDRAKIQERYGLTPEQFVDYKALRGDASDNIPGVSGIGEKTASELIQKYGSLDGVYAHLAELREKLAQKLRDEKEIAYLSKKLATIMCDAPVRLDLEAARADKVDRAAVYKLFRELDFKSLLDKLPGAPKGGDDPTLFDTGQAPVERKHLENVDYRCIQTRPALEELVALLQKQPVFAFDVETDDYDITSAKLVGLSMSWAEGQAYYIPVGHVEGSEKKRCEPQLPLDAVIAALKPVLEDPKIAIVGHNVKFDYQIMRRQGVTVQPLVFDTMIAAFLLNPLGRAQSLSDLAFRELGIEMVPIEELIGKRGKNQSSFDLATIEDATRYAAEDADVSWRLYQLYSERLNQEPMLRKLAEQIEWPLIPVLAEMEIAGIELDKSFLKQLSVDMGKQVIELDDQITKLAGEKFNVSSPGQLQRILFDKLGLSRQGVKKGKTGFSTAAGELDKLRGLHPIIDLISQYRELTKLKSTYIDALPALVRADGRVHTSFNQTIAQTGRLSSTNPNLQNIPIRTEVGRQIRKAFVAPAGRALVSADYSQIELRIAAALAKDPAMIKTFEEGIDLHLQTAAELYGVPLDQVTKEQRYNAKTINFGVLYGMSPHGLSVATGMDNKAAAEFIARYYAVRPKLKEYIEGIKQSAREKEYVETLFGRRRPCPEINSNNYMIASGAERMAVNVPIQGTAADIMKLAMVQLAAKLDAKTQMLLQIHDQLILETDSGQAAAVTKLLKDTMEHVYDLGVPIVVETGVGKHWGEL